MAALDYKQLGLKCGIEIHQQLEGKKLFCKCPTIIREDEPHFSVVRQLRAAAGEAGQVDIAALQEMKKKRQYSYQCYKDTTCLVELDESPPEAINQEAFRTALQVSKLLNAKTVDRAHVMRKTVVDGSNTSGFQRTALIGMNGSINTSFGNISIPTICLEEDSCRTIEEKPNEVVYSLDRLGIPLLEIGTTPDIKSPEHCREVCEKIGLLLRSTGKAKRGIGTIRQDINVSIKGGNRIEIKGAQDLKSIPLLVEREAIRQINLLEIKEELKKRRIKKFEAQIKDITNPTRNSGSKIIKKTIEANGVVLGIKLPGFARLVGKEIQPGRRLGTEFSDRAKVIAGVGGIFHSDELPNYGITDREVELIKHELGCLENDAFVIVADTKEKAKKALEAVAERANEAIDGVPCEVRGAKSDGNTTYQRPMPGAARMYPETDIPPITITKDLLDSIELPELIEDKIKRYEKMGLAKDLAELTARSEKARLFDKFVTEFLELKPAYLAEVLMTSAKTIKRNHNIDINPTEQDFIELFAALSAGQITKESVLDILKENKPVCEVLPKYHTLPDNELRAALKKIILENKGMPFNALIGIAMKQLRGKAPGEKIVQFLKALSS
ncbi:MAG: Glu-tRNA(Gln) amidotransferase subunit GatE [Candidatus Woesearchaeota archaeon]